jgi:hypothetical protein
MQLSTLVDIDPPAHRLDLGTSVLALGSCFAERVGARLSRALFPVTLNPTGTYYNPLSLAETLRPDPIRPELFLHDGLWRSLGHHSLLSGSDKRQTEACFHRAELERVQALTKSKVLLLTLGTAQIWKTVSGGRLVANCHRLPSSMFSRSRLNPEDCVDALKPLLQSWLDADNDRQVVLTVSPVRYLRDGLVDNSRGKAVLLLACAALERSHPGISYFPSYEIFLDELRDYRFYEADLVQPNALGVEYVWEKFGEKYLTPKAQSRLPLIERIRKLADHRLTERSRPRELGVKGLSLLEQLTNVEPQIDVSVLRRQFQDWAGI